MPRSRLRRTLSRWADSDDSYARDMREEHSGDGERTSIADAPDRVLVTLRGTIRSLVVRPRGGVPALEAELYDGSGVVLVVWLGRRRIAGIDPGRSVEVRGRIGVHEGHRTLFNPRYELLT